MAGTPTIHSIVDKQVAKVLRKGDRMAKFDQIRQRHFWSTYLFLADPTTNQIASGQYDIFKTIPGQSGQGYPTNINLTQRETNWLNSGRVPDNQNFAIQEVGCTVRNAPLENSTPGNTSSVGIYAALSTAQKTYVNFGLGRSLTTFDAWQIATNVVIEMSFLTNSVPLGLVADFSQSAGIMTMPNNFSGANEVSRHLLNVAPVNGLGAAAFRRKLEIPILLQHGENMGMRLNIPRTFTILDPEDQGGLGWFEIRVDWWAIESFVEKS
jgi:hypothetical protein